MFGPEISLVVTASLLRLLKLIVSEVKLDFNKKLDVIHQRYRPPQYSLAAYVVVGTTSISECIEVCHHMAER